MTHSFQILNSAPSVTHPPQETTYDAVVRLPSHEFQRICRDLSQFGESLVITCTKDGVQFSASGDIGSAKITLRQNSSIEGEKEQVHAKCSNVN